MMVGFGDLQRSYKDYANLFNTFVWTGPVTKPTVFRTVSYTFKNEPRRTPKTDINEEEFSEVIQTSKKTSHGSK